VLCCAVLCCAVLCCAVLCCIKPWYCIGRNKSQTREQKDINFQPVCY
jgi:hypothetical protein